jgi:hypothetical protein
MPASPHCRRTAPFPIPIADQHPMAASTPALAAVVIWTACPIKTSLVWGVDPSTWTRQEAKWRL